MRTFNKAGPIIPARHYHVPPLGRIDLDRVLGLVRDLRYFVLRAPRQSGKTTVLLALRDLLNAGGEHRCVYVNVEAGQAAREDAQEAMRVVLGELARQARRLGDDFLDGAWIGILDKNGPLDALGEALSRWAEAGPKPLVLLVDEIDSLVGDSLLSVLRQLRSGYVHRPEGFPQSVVLCGVRDMRDYRMDFGGGEPASGGSAFNIVEASLRLGNFSPEETRTLLGQHEDETGQAFSAEALAAVWEQTLGQPWLVNALALGACEAAGGFGETGRIVAAAHVEEARERLILARETHVDQFADKLREDRIRRIVEPMLGGEDVGGFDDRDVEYARDLGLLADDGPPRLANPIYMEVVPRELTAGVQERLEAVTAGASWYAGPDGRLDAARLMAAFQAFFREHSEHWRERFLFQEHWPQLLLLAFLQRVVNSGGRVEREFGLGRGRVDILVRWPLGEGARQTFAVECKVLRGSLEATIERGVEQLAGYMDRCGADGGHLAVFDRDGAKSWEKKIFRRSPRPGIEIWGM